MIRKYYEIIVFALLLCAISVWADDTIAQAYDSTSTPVSIQQSTPAPAASVENETLLLDEIRQLREELNSVRAALDTSAQSANTKEAQEMSRELRLLRGELNNIKSQLASDVITPYNKHKVALKAGISGEYLGILAMGAVNTKLSFNNRGKQASRYIGADLAAGYLGFYAGGNFGFEKTFLFDKGLQITSSFGAHAGVFGYSDMNLLTGIHSITEFSIYHKRFQPYLSAGIRLNGVGGMGLFGGFMSFPLGMGMSFKI